MYNHHSAEKAFHAYWEKESAKMLAAGMTPDTIHEMYLFDREWFNSERRTAEHICELPDSEPNSSMSIPEPTCEILDYISISAETLPNLVENPALYNILCTFPPQALQLLDLHLFHGYSLREIARMQNKHPSTVIEQYSRLRQLLSTVSRQTTSEHNSST